MQLVERRGYVCVMNLVGRRRDQRRLSLQPVKGRNFPGDRSQRSDLHVALFGDLLQARIIVLKLIFFGAQLVIAGKPSTACGYRSWQCRSG